MGYIETGLAKAQSLVGKRIELPVHLDMWMRGARYGVVTSFGRGGEWVFVKLDRLPDERRFKIFRLDYDYIQVID